MLSLFRLLLEQLALPPPSIPLFVLGVLVYNPQFCWPTITRPRVVVLLNDGQAYV